MLTCRLVAEFVILSDAWFVFTFAVSVIVACTVALFVLVSGIILTVCVTVNQFIGLFIIFLS